MKTPAPRCLMFYPWNLGDHTGSLALFLSYSRALKAAGFRLDCYAPRAADCDGLFDNIFVAPDSESPLVSQLEAAGSMLGDSLLPDQLGRDEASMTAAAVLASISDYDVVGIHYTRCHSLKRMLPPGTPTVMFTHDLDSLVGRQEEMIFGTPVSYRLTDEVSRLQPFNLVTVVGPDDRRALQTAEPSLPVVEAPFTCEIKEPITPRERTNGALLWISAASGAHRLSFYWFWTKVWPGIRSANPTCVLTVAGRISEIAQQLGAAADPQVSVLGVVGDAEERYQNTDVLIAPYYFGFGIKTKVIEALAKGIPVVTTTLGIYNTRIQSGREALVANKASEYAAHVIRVISSFELRCNLSRNGTDYVRRWHDPKTALTPMIEAFENVGRTKQVAAKSRAGAVRHLEAKLRDRLRLVIEDCYRDCVETVAIYGAGSHTHMLIPIWQSLGGPAVVSVIETEQPSKATCDGFPLVSAHSFDPNRVDAIVLSSYGYEQALAAICSERWPSLKVYPIWQSALQNFELACQEEIPASLYEFI